MNLRRMKGKVGEEGEGETKVTYVALEWRKN